MCAGRQPATILVVEDDRTAAGLFQRVLTTAGYRVVLAGSGTAAIEAAQAEHPDLILLDIVIPAPNGFDVCARLKQDPATRKVPVVFISGLPELPNWHRGRELGAVDYLAKPFELEQLTARVRKHLKAERAH
jgi:DNA-binding response OmpR family regulator